MRTKLLILALLGGLASGCPDSGEECAVGAESCTCTSAGLCDLGRMCVEGRCLGPSGSSSAGEPPGGPTQGGGNAVEPLPADEVVFEKLIKRGGTEAPLVSHLYSYNLSTRQERLISQLDDNVGRGSRIKGMAVSPDRKAIAFASSSFRPSQADLSAGFPTGAIWAVSVDGKQFVRFTPPFTTGNGSGEMCANSSTCPGDEICMSGRCRLRGFHTAVNAPAWSADGKTLFFQVLTEWIAERPTGPIAAGGQKVRVSVGGKPPVQAAPLLPGERPSGPQSERTVHAGSGEDLRGFDGGRPVRMEHDARRATAAGGGGPHDGLASLDRQRNAGMAQRWLGCAGGRGV